MDKKALLEFLERGARYFPEKSSPIMKCSKGTTTCSLKLAAEVLECSEVWNYADSDMYDDVGSRVARVNRSEFEKFLDEALQQDRATKTFRASVREEYGTRTPETRQTWDSKDTGFLDSECKFNLEKVTASHYRVSVSFRNCGMQFEFQEK
ncbi:hypothetical protein FJZ19_01145 [Candidatus Pacearchaeota archaeon]|nr:hypothetical protein [Candidatus Pacearchaeota archaeon]